MVECDVLEAFVAARDRLAALVRYQLGWWLRLHAELIASKWPTTRKGSARYAQLLDAAEIAELAEAIDDLHLAAAQRLGRLDRTQRQDHAALGSTKPAIGQRLDQLVGDVDHLLHARFVDHHATAP